MENQEEKPVEKLLDKLKKKLTKEQREELTKKIKEGLIKNRKKIAVGCMVSIGTLLIVYLGMTVYFKNHFYFGSEINGISVSGKSVEKVNEQMAAELYIYSLEIKGREGKAEQIKADEIGLRYSSDDEFKNLKDSQNPYAWVSAVFNTEEHKMTAKVIYDENMLKERVEKLSIFDKNNIIEPKNASFKYENNSYVIVPEVNGNKVNKENLYGHVIRAIANEDTVIDLEAAGCYEKPQYTSVSQKIVDTKNLLNKYAASKVTYTFGEAKEVLDGSTINKWLTVDDNLEVKFNEEQAKKYVDTLANTYNTAGKTKSFLTTSGNTINISGGDYGWSINKAKETEALVTAIKEGKTITKEPAYLQTGLSRDNNGIGKTYVEIDMSRQHLWFYKNGELIVQGDVVTGNVSANHTTPAGIYRLKYKQKNAVLRGPGYAAPVSFWMPFNGGIGIHDASWRSVFGGKIYKTDGSHGCINSPHNLAKTIYDNIAVGTPVVCYY
jgi:lipoprotein-anchoring transpeptidase ErfK/SrfK